MKYVDAGYVVALGSLFVYALTLLARRRRWQRALELSEAPFTEGEAPLTEGEAAPARGGRS